MRARRGSLLTGGTANPYATAEDVNPNSYITNLVDCMLVLALGLMLALVTAWNAQVPNLQEVQQTQNMQEVSNLDQLTDPESLGGSGYVDMGSVYQDPKTGKMYLIQQSGDSDSSSDGSTGGTTAGGAVSNSQTSPNSLPQSGSSASGSSSASGTSSSGGQ